MRAYTTFMICAGGFLVTAALFGAGCSSSNKAYETSPSYGSMGSSATGDTAVLSISSRAPANQRVVISQTGPQQLYLTSDQGDYTFSIAELGINETVMRGDTVVVDLTGKPAGEYKIHRHDAGYGHERSDEYRGYPGHHRPRIEPDGQHLRTIRIERDGRVIARYDRDVATERIERYERNRKHGWLYMGQRRRLNLG